MNVNKAFLIWLLVPRPALGRKADDPGVPQLINRRIEWLCGAFAGITAGLVVLLLDIWTVFNINSAGGGLLGSAFWIGGSVWLYRFLAPRWKRKALILAGLDPSAIVKWAEEQPLIKRVFLFGSVASGTAGPESDLDIAVQLIGGPSETFSDYMCERATWAESLEAVIGRKVDLQLLDQERCPDVWGFVQKASILIYERESIGRGD